MRKYLYCECFDTRKIFAFNETKMCNFIGEFLSLDSAMYADEFLIKTLSELLRHRIVGIKLARAASI